MHDRTSTPHGTLWQRLLLLMGSTMGSTPSETLTSIGPSILSTVALGAGEMYQLPEWKFTPTPVATVAPLASVRATCAGGEHSTYDWALLMPIRKPGVLWRPTTTTWSSSRYR